MTNSELDDWRRCKRKHWLKYVLRLIPNREGLNENRTIGNLVHAGLADWYASGGDADPAQAVEYLTAALREEYADDASAQKAIDKAFEFATIILSGYFEWLREEGEDQGLKILAAETEVWAKMDIPAVEEEVYLLGKFDLRVLREEDGARLFMDHKTVDNFSNITKTARIDTQFLHYELIERLCSLGLGNLDPSQIGERTDGGVYNMLRRVKRTKSATPPFYQRHTERHNDSVLRNYYRRIYAEIESILATRRFLLAAEQWEAHFVYAPPTPSRECAWDCEYFALCGMLDDDHDDHELMIEMAYHTGNPLARYAAASPERSQEEV